MESVRQTHSAAGVEALLKAAATAAEKAVHELWTGKPRDTRYGPNMRDVPGTTLSAAAVTPDGLHWIWAGDSPVLLVDKTGNVRAISDPHHLPKQPNILTNFVMHGIETTWCVGNLDRHDILRGWLVVATDGIDTIEPAEVGSAVRNAGDDPAGALVQTVIDRGKPRQDNVTATVITIG